MDASLQGFLSLSLGSGPSSVPTKHATGFTPLVSEGKAPAVVCVGGSDDGMVIMSTMGVYDSPTGGGSDCLGGPVGYRIEERGRLLEGGVYAGGTIGLTVGLRSGMES